jgi:mono/diheme cytochrome c family protein
MRPLKRIGLGLAALALFLLVGAGIHVWLDVDAFDASMSKVYDVPAPNVASSMDPAVVAHGKQLAESVGSCTSASCHGRDLGGGQTFALGPLATISGPNITSALLARYSDGELARLLTHGIKRDGHGVLFMPVQNFSWLPPADIEAIVSYLRTAPPVERANGPLKVTFLGKELDRRGRANLDVARRLEGEPRELSPAAAPTAEYGAFLSRACTMCHGDHLAGGRIPGAPSSMPVPLNLTPDATGLSDWSFEDFDRLMTTGIRRNGKKLDPFMPVDAFAKYDDVQKRALWAYLRSLPPRPFGTR